MALRRWESEGQKNLDLLAGFFSTVAYLPRQLGIYPAKSYQKGLFSDSLLLFFLRDLSGNNIEFIKEGVFNGLPKLSTL